MPVEVKLLSATQFLLTTLVVKLAVVAALATMLILAAADIVRLMLNVFFWAIVIRVVMSWVNPGGRNPVNSLVGSLTEPLLERARRILPPMSGFDLSLIPVLIVLQLAQILVVASLRSFAGY